MTRFAELGAAALASGAQVVDAEQEIGRDIRERPEGETPAWMSSSARKGVPSIVISPFPSVPSVSAMPRPTTAQTRRAHAALSTLA